MNWIELAIIAIALIFNLVFNYILNKKFLISNFNKFIYLIVWLGSAVVLFILRYSSNDSLSLMSLFYATVAFSYPQVVISLLANKDYEKSKGELEEKFNKLEEKFNKQQDLAKTTLAMSDEPEAAELLAGGMPLKEVERIFRQKMEDYVKYEMLPQEKGNDYLCCVLYHGKIASKRGNVAPPTLTTLPKPR